MSALSEYPFLLRFILKELDRQVVAHERVVKLRLYMYYNLRPRVDGLWIRLNEGINEAVEQGRVRRLDASKAWIFRAGADEGAVHESYERKLPVYQRWAGHAGGPHLERLVRRAFFLAGYAVSPTPVNVEWEGKAGEILSHQLDVLTLAPHRLGIECKNKLSDVYISPDIPKRPNDDHRQIARHFDICSRRGITPILMAPLIDASFFGFVQLYNGLACRLLFQYLPPDSEELCQSVRREFRIGHVVTASEDDPPQNLAAWAARVAGLLESRTGEEG